MTTIEATRPLLSCAAASAKTSAPGRTLLGYLLVPRPKDLVKAVVLPLTFALGAAANGRVSTPQLWRATLVWLVLELLVYQARYQWNDVRGFAADQAHPDRAARGRLPGPVERARAHIGASLAVAALRLLLTAGVGLAVPELRGVLLAATVGVFAVAFLYEQVRSMATGRKTKMPVPLRPSLVALWIAVGAGYAVRGLTGLFLAVQLGGRPALVVSAIVAMWAFGVVFVTCRWALEALSFASFRGEDVDWDARRAKAREHTLGLVRWLPETIDRRVVSAVVGTAHWRALQGRTALTAPWHQSHDVAAASAAVAGRLLVGNLGDGAGTAVAVVAAVAAIAITRLRERRAAAALAAAVALSGVQWLAGLDRPLVATLPWLVVMIGYACFTGQCACEIGRPLRRLASPLGP
jgi:hypothetical protein